MLEKPHSERERGMAACSRSVVPTSPWRHCFQGVSVQIHECCKAGLEFSCYGCQRQAAIGFSSYADRDSIKYEDIYNIDNLRAGYNRLKATASPGIDGRARAEMTEKGLENLSKELRRQTYAPKPSQRITIPTPDGGRPVSVASMVDKVVLSTLKGLVEPVVEPTFRESSHGFRPGRSCHTALRELRHSWMAITWLVQIDIEKQFDKVHHSLLLKQMSQVLPSKSLQDLMRKLLNAGYVDLHNLSDCTQYNRGALMGSIISPLCANIFLHDLDCYVESDLTPEYNVGDLRLLMSGSPSCQADEGFKRLKYLRYADSIMLGVKGSKQDALNMRGAVQSFLKKELRLNIIEDKSLVLNARSEMAKFLGALVAFS